MADVLLFHHAHGRTTGVLEFAERLRGAGHAVHVPDLYEGRVFEDLEQGLAHAQEVGFATLVERGTTAAEPLPDSLVYAGFSLGVLPAQKLAQTRPGASGALLVSSCIPTAELGGPWPEGVPVQVHGMAGDPFFLEDLPAAEALVRQAPSAELFRYPGSAHLFADASLPDHDAEAARLLEERVLAFLERVR